MHGASSKWPLCDQKTLRKKVPLRTPIFLAVWCKNRARFSASNFASNYRKSINDPQGVNMHTALALSPRGLPLGLLSNTLFSREPENPKDRIPRKIRERKDHLIPTDEKESYKWIHTLEKNNEVLGKQVKSVTVCDRECDFHDFFLAANDFGMDVVVRSNADRNVGSREVPMRLSQKLQITPAYEETVTIEVPVKQIGGGKGIEQKKRKAEKCRLNEAEKLKKFWLYFLLLHGDFFG